MEKPDFRVGDEVYCLATGKGIIVDINEDYTNDYTNDYPIKVEFGDKDNNDTEDYTVFGQLFTANDKHGLAPRCLFHNKGFQVQTSEETPKRKKKVWVNLYSQTDTNEIKGRYYPTEKIADARAAQGRIACVEVEIPA